MMKRGFFSVGAVFPLIICIGAFAAEKGKTTKVTETPEMRQKMADAHEKMAECLRSDKPMNECWEDMRKSCKEATGKEGCPMMGGGRWHNKEMKGEKDYE